MAYFCSKCGRGLINENACCGYCGTWHGFSSSNKNKAVSRCSKCDRKLSIGSGCCGYCGNWHLK